MEIMSSRHVRAIVVLLAACGCASAFAARDYSNGTPSGLAAYDQSWHGFSKLYGTKDGWVAPGKAEDAPARPPLSDKQKKRHIGPR